MFVELGRHWVQTCHLPWGGSAFRCPDVLMTHICVQVMHFMTFWLKASLCQSPAISKIKKKKNYYRSAGLTAERSSDTLG